jgi:hypothetical protein
MNFERLLLDEISGTVVSTLEHGSEDVLELPALSKVLSWHALGFAQPHTKRSSHFYNLATGSHITSSPTH